MIVYSDDVDDVVFQFPIGFSLGVDPLITPEASQILSIPYRILTAENAKKDFEAFLTFQFPNGFSQSIYHKGKLVIRILSIP